MMDIEKELEQIFADPLVANVVTPRKRTTSSDRLIAGFQEILKFVEDKGRLPENTPEEASVYHKWKGLLKSEKKIEHCRPFDNLGILPQPLDEAAEPEAEYRKEPTQAEQLDAILNDPIFSECESGIDLGLFDIPDYMRERLDARKEAEYVGKRRPCEDFGKYAGKFREIHQGLKSGRYRLEKFSVKNLRVGSYFVEDGVLGYLAAFDDEGVNSHHERDGRTRVIYENGSESDIKYKTITKNLSVTGYSVIDCSDMAPEELMTVSDSDVESGTIYVLRSKSKRPEISGVKDLYKIGFTATTVESRIANASKEPTYLCADVEIVTSWKVYNVKSSSLETLIHRLFESVRFQAVIDGHRPKEWFVVPLKVIEEAIKAMINHKSVKYLPGLKQLVYL